MTNVGQIFLFIQTMSFIFPVDIDQCVFPVPFEVLLQKYLLSATVCNIH